MIMDLGSAVVGSVALGFPVLGSFYKLSQFSSHVKGVDEQTKDLLLTAYHIESNLKEARRLRTIKAALLDASERSWMDNVIRDTEYALLGVAKLVEPARIDLRIGKSVGFINRVDWVLRQSIKVAGKHTRLTTCHQSLVAAISSLNLKPVKPKIGTISEEYPSPHDPHMQRFLNFQNQRYRRRSIMSLRSEGTSAESGSLTSSPSTMTKATSDRNSGSSTTGSVNSSSMISLPKFEVLNMEPSPGNNKLSTDFIQDPFCCREAALLFLLLLCLDSTATQTRQMSGMIQELAARKITPTFRCFLRPTPTLPSALHKLQTLSVTPRPYATAETILLQPQFHYLRHRFPAQMAYRFTTLIHLIIFLPSSIHCIHAHLPPASFTTL